MITFGVSNTILMRHNYIQKRLLQKLHHIKQIRHI